MCYYETGEVELCAEETPGTPFYSDDHFDVFKKIVKGEIPEGTWKRMSPEAADCVKALLVKEPEKRLGAVEKGGPRMIRETKFFQPLDFVKLLVPELDDRPRFFRRVC